jgi:hypothetical protein
VKFVPLMVTLVPTGPLVGAKLVIVGGLATTVKLLALVAVPPGVVTLIGPVVAPVGTVACIAVAELTTKLALTPLQVTAVAPVKFVPLIVTLVPTGPLVGVKLVIVGGLETVTVTVSEVQRRFRPSRATAVKVCDPLLAVLVSQGTEYGFEVTSAPRLAPSSLNWTPWTVTAPMRVTSALTVMVPPTGDPEVGDVMVTIRLPPPSWADASGAESQAKPRITRRAAA